MSKLGERFAAFRIKRYNRAVSDQSWNFFGGRVFLFILVIGSVVTSWTYFVFSIAKWNKGFAFESDKYTELLLALMLACYFGLRKALARIATAPAGALDERDLELRNDAFRMAYLVIRRVGLGFVLISSAILGINGVFYQNFVTRPSYFDAYRDVSLVKWLSNSLVDLMDSGRGIWILLSVLITLTYCAYSFPLVILGWRQAIGQKIRMSGAPEYETFAEWSAAMRKVTMNFVILMASVAVTPLLLVLLGFLAISRQQSAQYDPFSLEVYLTQFVLGALTLWCILVYFWSWLSMLRARHLYRSSQASHLKAARRSNLIMMIATPLVLVGSFGMQDLARFALTNENYQAFMALSSLVYLMLLLAVAGPSIAMVAAAVARRKKPVEVVEQATSEV
jgi:hypothetical protein